MSSFKELKKIVYEGNVELYDSGLAFHTIGNVSGIDREAGIIAIKPSGIPYKELTPEDIVLVNLDNEPIENGLRPSSDTPTHTSLYRAFPNIGGVAHTHSTYATAWAQALRPIPCLGTTHADYLPVRVPCTESMTDEQVRGDYEAETGRQIIKALEGLSHAEVPMVLVASHGPFTWGRSPREAVHHSAVLEELARMALFSMLLSPLTAELLPSIIDRHFNRKHGEDASYGQ